MMNYELFFLPLLVSFGLTGVIVSALVLLRKKKVDGRNSLRHIHRPGVSRFGGAAVIAAFLLTLLWDRNLASSPQLVGLLAGAGAILVFGIIDDLFEIGWKWQLAFQIVLVAGVSLIGLKLDFVANPLGGVFSFDTPQGYMAGLLIGIGWIVLLMNAMNWLDGIDGVSGGVTLIAAATIFLLSLRPEVNQPPVGIITASLVGALLGFLIFNFHPAKIMAGTSGSMLMGFALAALAIFAGAKIATTLLVLAVPVIDALWVIGERLMARRSIFSPDQRHLHFRLLDLGWSQRKICFFYWSVTLGIAIIALNTRALGKITTFLIVLILTGGSLLALRKKALAGEKKI